MSYTILMKMSRFLLLCTGLANFGIYPTANAQQAGTSKTHWSTIAACNMSADLRSGYLLPKSEYNPNSQYIIYKENGGRPLKTTGNILAAVGGGMMGWYLGTKLGDEDAEISSGILIGGAALTITGIVLSTIGRKQITRSLSHNNKFQPSLSFQKDYRGNIAYCIQVTSIIK